PVELEFVGGDAADDFALDDGVAERGVRVQQAGSFMEHAAALGLEILGLRGGEFVVLKIDVAAAALAHRGFRGGRNLQFRAALETGTAPQAARGPCAGAAGGPGARAQDVLQSKVLAALTASSGVSRRRFLLSMPAARAGDGNTLRLHGCDSGTPVR